MTVLDLEDAGRQFVQEIPVVGDDDERAAVTLQIAFQPFERTDVQVVRRLIQQQHVRLLQQQRSHSEPRAFAAGEGAHRLVQVVVRKSEAAQDALQALVVAVSVTLFKGFFLLFRCGLRNFLLHGTAVGEVVALL